MDRDAHGRRVGEDVDEVPAVPPDERRTAQHRELRRAGPEEVEKPADGRQVPAGERTASAAEPEELEQHAPDDRLLKRGGLQPPRFQVGDMAHPGREPAEEEPARDIAGDLQRVREVDRDRRTVALEAQDAQTRRLRSANGIFAQASGS